MNDQQYNTLMRGMERLEDKQDRLQETISGEQGVLVKLEGMRVEQKWMKWAMRSSVAALATAIGAWFRH